MAPSRRRYLQLAGSAVAAGLTGCATASPSASEPTVTPAPVPADSPVATSTAAIPPPAASELGFAVQALDDFTELSPARLRIAFWNAGDRVLTALDGPEYVLPFVDDDYAGVDGQGRRNLLLLPEGARIAIEPQDGRVGSIQEFLPAAPSDGCWRLPFDWPDAWGPQTAILHAVALAPGERRRHAYELYFIDDCAAGTYRFEHTFDLAAGDPPHESDLHRARLAFEATVSDSGAVTAGALDPVVGEPVADG